MLHVISAKYLHGYQIEASFNDSETHIIDFKNTIFCDTRKIVQELQNTETFKKFSVKRHTITWENGLDFAPEFIKSCSVHIVKKSA